MSFSSRRSTGFSWLAFTTSLTASRQIVCCGSGSALDLPSMDDLALKMQYPREAARAIMGSVRLRKDLFTAHQCGVPAE